MDKTTCDIVMDLWTVVFLGILLVLWAKEASSIWVIAAFVIWLVGFTGIWSQR